MSFRRTKNAHEQWLGYCQEHKRALQATSLPEDLFRRADLLQGFLREGSFRSADGAETFLADVADNCFLALEEFINGCFDFQDAYPALQQERFRRFRRYG